MGFYVHHNIDGAVAPFEYFKPLTTYAVGTALVFNNGYLEKAGTTAKPEYIAMGNEDDWGFMPVIQVVPGTVYETTLSANGSSLKLGQKVTISSDGQQVTATTSSGVAEIVAMEDTAAGSKVLVRF